MILLVVGQLESDDQWKQESGLLELRWSNQDEKNGCQNRLDEGGTRQLVQ